EGGYWTKVRVLGRVVTCKGPYPTRELAHLAMLRRLNQLGIPRKRREHGKQVARQSQRRKLAERAAAVRTLWDAGQSVGQIAESLWLSARQVENALWPTRAECLRVVVELAGRDWSAEKIAGHLGRTVTSVSEALREARREAKMADGAG